MLDSKFTSQNIMNYLMAASLQRPNGNLKFKTSFRRRYYEVVPTLRQLCKEHQTWDIHDHIVTFLQACLKVVEKINNPTKFVWYAGSIL